MVIKAEAVLLLMRNEATKRQTFERLFEIQSPYGFRNKSLVKNIEIADKKRLKEARGHLVRLSHRGGFWNRKLREITSQVLEKWDAEQS